MGSFACPFRVDDDVTSDCVGKPQTALLVPREPVASSPERLDVAAADSSVATACVDEWEEPPIAQVDDMLT